MKPMTRFSCIVGGGCLTLLAGGSQLEGRRAAQSLPAAGTESRAPFTLSGLPVDLIENRGQWDTSARFVATRGAAWTALEPDGFALHVAGSHSAPVRLVFENTPGRVSLAGEERRRGRYNFECEMGLAWALQWAANRGVDG